MQDITNKLKLQDGIEAKKLQELLDELNKAKEECEIVIKFHTKELNRAKEKLSKKTENLRILNNLIGKIDNALPVRE